MDFMMLVREGPGRGEANPLPNITGTTPKNKIIGWMRNRDGNLSFSRGISEFAMHRTECTVMRSIMIRDDSFFGGVRILPEGYDSLQV